ncbi:MAG: ATP-dependent helicase [Anaerolineales bacterium]|nr:ATP-dependent helicase [Anaerolineales bacterium]
MTDFSPRPSQQNILRYAGGRLGIAAVPGAGKTHILSALAAQIIQENQLQDGQEVLIVTLVNSAVDNFENRIKGFFENPVQVLYKYRVRTLHGLAHDIVREKPASVGLENQFSIIDEREADFIRRESVNAWLAAHPDFLDDYLDPALDTSKRDWVKRQQLPNLVDSLALAFIRSSKDRLLTPDSLRLKLDSSFAPLPLAELGWSIYADYQRALAYRGAVDFDDLIRLALTLLQNDEEYLERLRFRYPFILEDEAQDSSRTQQKILSLLSGSLLPESFDKLRTSSASEVEGGVAGDDALRLRSSESTRRSAQRGEGGPSTTLLGERSSLRSGWVRVGDPNQAIFETFTTADPDLLREFIRTNPNADMPESGRSQPSIIALANHLIDWTMTSHPDPNVRSALSLPHIEPVPAGYEPVNPPDNPEGIRFISRKFTPEEELEAVVKSVKSHLDSFANSAHEEKPTIAVLVPRNQRGVEVVESLRKRGVEAIELISSTANTRAAAGSLNYLLSYLADPQSARKLSKAYEVFRRDWREQGLGISELGIRESDPELLKGVTAILRRLVYVEKFIAPSQADDWLATVGESEAEHVIQELMEFRVNVQRWLNAVTLPIDQLVLTLAQDVFSEASDLALAHKLALVLRQAANDHADWRLPELTSELAVIAKNERRFIGFSSDDSGFDPERHRGKVVVTTMHKAKGMEWDRVYMMSVNNYDFPSNMPNDHFISEKWFVRSGLNLEAEALAQLTALESTSEYDWYEEGAATMQSRLGYVKERLRLLYVGITRAKKDLIVTWNSGRQGDATPSLAMSELMGWWENFTK